MAERRMFAKQIIDSDSFLDMPVTARLLYYDLAMRADDDGFINSPKKIMRMIGASQDDLSVLIAKKFIIPFDTGVVVIKHWRIHNYIQKDRYKPTNYQDELSQLTVKPNKSYSLAAVSTLDTPCIQSVSTLDSQVRLGKDRLGKDSIDSYSVTVAGADVSLDVDQMPSFDREFEVIWSLYPRKQGKRDAFKHYVKARKKGVSALTIQTGIENYCRYIQANHIEPRYVKQGSAWFNQECWNDDYTIRLKEVTTADLTADLDSIAEVWR